LFGATAGVVFLVTLLSSGIASSVVGTLAGQAIMEGLLGKKVNVWLRRFITRFVNVIPISSTIREHNSLLGASESGSISLTSEYTEAFSWTFIRGLP
jgi:NRAMP (natural resistance-associated macrophage protein)-like metal ion transporter